MSITWLIFFLLAWTNEEPKKRASLTYRDMFLEFILNANLINI